MRIHAAACLLLVSWASPVCSFVAQSNVRKSSSGLQLMPEDEIVEAIEKLGTNLKQKQEEAIELLETLGSATTNFATERKPFFANPLPASQATPPTNGEVPAPQVSPEAPMEDFTPEVEEPVALVEALAAQVEDPVAPVEEALAAEVEEPVAPVEAQDFTPEVEEAPVAPVEAQEFTPEVQENVVVDQGSYVPPQVETTAPASGWDVYNYESSSRLPTGPTPFDMIPPREPTGDRVAPTAFAGQAFSESPRDVKTTPIVGENPYVYVSNTRGHNSPSEFDRTLPRDSMRSGHAFSVSPQDVKTAPVRGENTYKYVSNSRRYNGPSSFDLTPPREATNQQGLGGHAYSVSPQDVKTTPVRGENPYTYVSNTRGHNSPSSFDLTPPREATGQNGLGGQAYSVSPQEVGTTPVRGENPYTYVSNTRGLNGPSSFDLTPPREVTGPTVLGGQAYSVSPQEVGTTPVRGENPYTYVSNTRGLNAPSSFDLTPPREPAPNNFGGHSYSAAPRYEKSTPVRGGN